MIPRKLQLKNFLSYGSKPQTIDFSSYHLICLSGKNGHGKSALLDAITWAIWGTARKVIGGSRADMDLVHLGQTQMIVIFDFEFNGSLYRIRREYTKHPIKPAMALDFGIFDAATQKFSPLTEKTIRTTQATIDRTLNLTFESFVNSAFLRQGQSNEFSKKTPKDRKNILANILGLDHYELVRKLATEKAKKASFEREALCALEVTLREQLQQQIVQDQYDVVMKQLTSIGEQESTAETEKERLEKTRTIFIEQQKEYELLGRQLQQLHTEQTSQQHTLRTVMREWRTVHAQMIKTMDPHALEQKKSAISHMIHTHQQQLQTQLTIKEKLLHKRDEMRHIEQRRQEAYNNKMQAKKISLERLLIEKSSVEKTQRELRQQQTVAVNEQTLLNTQEADIQKRLAATSSISELRTSTIKQFEKRKEYYQTFIVQANWITKELDNLAQKQQSIQDENNPSCPVCEQNLSASRKRFLKGSLTKQEESSRHRLKRLTHIIQRLKTVLIEQHEQCALMQKKMDETHTLVAQQEELIKTRTKLAALIADLTAQQARHAQELIYKTTLIAQEEAALQQLESIEKQARALDPEHKELSLVIETLEKQLRETIYNPQAHQELILQMQDVEQQVLRYAHIHEQVMTQEHRKHTVSELCGQLKQLKVEICRMQKLLQTYATLEEQETALKQSEQLQQTNRQKLQYEKNMLLQDKGRLEQQIVAMSKLEQEHKQQQQRIADLAGTIDDYYLIAQATGKDGVQALLIEDTIPEIEHEANMLLSKLTNNQAHITIESLKDLKKGGTKETLDIKISDAAGIRPYELFSGGEAFRIDFALRIAISKLLARRSGASLQTLIIDEGFGSQDEEGLIHIMDAIHAIQSDFSKVIIVSHLPAMKDQFPVHFFVEKGAQGSIVHVIEQG